VEAHTGGFDELGLEVACVSSNYNPLATPDSTEVWKCSLDVCSGMMGSGFGG